MLHSLQVEISAILLITSKILLIQLEKTLVENE